MRAEVGGGVTAALEATFSPSAVGVTASIHRTPPLELRGPFRREDEDAHLFFLRNVTAGVFGGDRYTVRLSTTPGAQVRVAGTSATKVYGMPGRFAESYVTIAAAAQSLLCYSPPPLILQAGSDFSQTVDVRVASGGVAIASEIVVPGRLAAGERLAFRRFRSSLRVAVNDEPELYMEQFSLDDGVSTDVALGGYSVFAVVLAAGIDARLAATNVRKRLEEFGNCYLGVSVLSADGFVAKVLSHDTSAASRAIAIAEAEVLRSRGAGTAEKTQVDTTVC